MKVVLFAIMSFINVISVAQAPKFEVDNAVHKFPDSREGEQLSHTFTITNTGNAPLIISDYKVSCPCTVAELPANPIMPGESYKMKVTFDSKGKYEWQDRVILLQTNTKKKEEKLRIKVYVIPQ